MSRKRYRPALSAPQGLDRVLASAGEDRFAFHRPPIQAHVWTEVVGARIAERASPVTLERGVLVVRAATSVWANELSMLSTTLIARLREAGVAVRELRFRVGPIEPPARPAERRVARRIPPPAPLEPDLRRAIDGVADLELRETIAAAARANLAWQAYGVDPPEAPANEESRGARAPRAAEGGSAPPARSSEAAREAARRTRGGG